MNPIYFIVLFIGSALITHILLKMVYRYARTRLLDIPNERSSHSTPTPRGGGVAVSLCSILLLAYLSIDGLITASILAPLTLCTFILATLGYIDDHLCLGRRLRLGVTLVTTATCLLLLPLPNLQIANVVISAPWIIFPTLLIGAVWTINLFNFMDGIDGIATIEVITVLGAASLLLFVNESYEWAFLLLLLTAPAITFLFWNFAPAKIFLGDAGSYFWGSLIGLLAITTAALTDLSLWCWLILFAVFVADSTWTLIARIKTGQKWSSPHRSHAYQKIATKTKSHRSVSLATGGITLLWLTPLAYIAMTLPAYASILTLLAYAPLLCICKLSNAGSRTKKSTD